MKQLQFVGGTTAENDPFVGPARMLTIDTDRWEVRLHDNETPGGHRILNLDQLKLIFMQLTSEFGGVAFAPTDKGFLVRVGDKQYALRSLAAGTGIAITNPAGTAGNPNIGIDPNYISGLSFVANSIAFGGPTGGTADVLTLTLPDNWPNADGSVAVFSFHVAPNDGATLSVNASTGIPLLTPQGSNKLSQIAKINTRVLIVRDTDNYYMIGMGKASEIGIDAIAGMAATNVQAALAELQAAINGIPGTPENGVFYTFGNYGQAPTLEGAYYYIPLADGEKRLFFINSPGGSYRSGGREGDENDFGGRIIINGVEVGGNKTSTLGIALWGIISRVGTAIWFAPLCWPFIWSAEAKVFHGTVFRVGNVAADATKVQIMQSIFDFSGRSVSANVTIKYSDNGVVVT